MSLFQIPRYLRMPACGIDISTDVIRIIDLVPHKDFFEVGIHGEEPIPSGIVHKGSVQDPIALASLLRDIAQKYSLSRAHVSLPEEQSFLVEMELPRVVGMDIKTTIELHLEEYIPISPSESIFDYVVVPSEKAGMITVIVSAFPETIIGQYLEAFRDTGIQVKSFEPQSQAIARAIFPQTTTHAYMGVDIGKDVTNIFIAKSGTVYFSAMLDFGGDHISVSLAKHLNMSQEEAEQVKITQGLLGGTDNDRVRSGMSPVLKDLSERITRYVTFWNSRHGGENVVKEIYLCGGGANLKGLSEYLGAEVGGEFFVANPWRNVAAFDVYTPPIVYEKSQGFAATIGLALRDEMETAL
jgi:type IV pilus assembly protein PilM